MPFTDLLDPSRPLVIAHRGASGAAPENTMAAFSLAVGQGAQVVELDVHMTADYYPVVIHDATVDRTTNGTGLVREKTLAELQRLDAGSWFDARYAGERVPALEEVVTWAKGRIPLAIEVKDTPFPYRGIEASVTGVLERHGAILDNEVFSFDHPCVRRFKARDPRLLTGVCYSDNPVDHNALAAAANATVLHSMFHHLRPNAVRDAHAAGLLVFAWTVDAPQDIQQMIALGVDGITTNFPQRVRKMVGG